MTDKKIYFLSESTWRVTSSIIKLIKSTCSVNRYKCLGRRKQSKTLMPSSASGCFYGLFEKRLGSTTFYFCYKCKNIWHSKLTVTGFSVYLGQKGCLKNFKTFVFSRRYYIYWAQKCTFIPLKNRKDCTGRCVTVWNVWIVICSVKILCNIVYYVFYIQIHFQRFIFGLCPSSILQHQIALIMPFWIWIDGKDIACECGNSRKLVSFKNQPVEKFDYSIFLPIAS